MIIKKLDNSFNRMKIKKITRQLLKKCDLFSTSQFLRYQEDEDYTTASGGICSLIVITVFMVLFMNTAIQTIDMTNITWTSTTQNLFNPSESNITITTPSKDSNSFMFAINIMGVNLNSNNSRIFDVTLIEHQIKRGGIQTGSSTVPLVPCTIEHFSANQNIRQSFHTLPTHRWMCPQLNYTFSLHGKYTSQTMEYIQIRVSKCNDTLDPSRPCASTSEIDDLQAYLGQFTVGMFFINPLINPGDQDYISYYLQDRNYITFTRQLGAYGNGFIEDFQIDTDISLLPNVQNIADKGVMITQLFQSIVYQVNGDDYASFYFLKSSRSTTYSRSFTKIDSFFSYIGGLVGTILGFMLIVSKYSQFSFEMDLSQKLFCYKEDQKSNFKDSNLFTYIVYLCYCLCDYLGCCKKWKKMKQYRQCRQQITKQLNIDVILSKISFLQNAIEQLMDPIQLDALYHRKEDTLTKIKQRRRRYKVKQKLRKDLSNDQSSSESENDNKEQEQITQNNKNNVSNSHQTIVQINDSMIKHIEHVNLEQPKQKEQLIFQTINVNSQKQKQIENLRLRTKQVSIKNHIDKNFIKGNMSQSNERTENGKYNGQFHFLS